MKKSWRCFHCDELFTDRAAAEDHFGGDGLSIAACKINETEYRRMERYYQRCLAEDSDTDREFHALRSDHQRALLRVEEIGYERGMRDMRAELKQAGHKQKAS